MLTIDEIRSIEFEKGLRGYKVDAVHDFLDQIAVQIDKLTKEKDDLEKKLYILAGKVEEYRSEEDMLKTAMINAQRMGENVIREAKQKADEIIRNADLQASLINEKSKEKMKSEEENFVVLQQKITSFKAQVLAIYKTHIESLSELPVFDIDDAEDEKEPQLAPVFVNSNENEVGFSQSIPSEHLLDNNDMSDASANTIDNFFAKEFDKEIEPQFLDISQNEENSTSDLDQMFGLSRHSDAEVEMLNEYDDDIYDKFDEKSEEFKCEDDDSDEEVIVYEKSVPKTSTINEEKNNDNIFSGFFDYKNEIQEEEIEKPPLKSSIFEKFNGINFNE